MPARNIPVHGANTCSGMGIHFNVTVCEVLSHYFCAQGTMLGFGSRIRKYRYSTHISGKTRPRTGTAIISVWSPVVWISRYRSLVAW